MGFEEKVDVIDLIINVLRDHEKTLDELISKLEGALDRSAPARSAPAGSPAVPSDTRRPTVTVILRRWSEFRDRCVEATLVAFDIEEKKLNVWAVKNDVLYLYLEEMPDMEIRFSAKDERIVIDGIDISRAELVPTVLRGRLECGLDISMKGSEVKQPDGIALYKVDYNVDSEGTKSWLSEQLMTNKSNILQGRIQI